MGTTSFGEWRGCYVAYDEFANFALYSWCISCYCRFFKLCVGYLHPNRLDCIQIRFAVYRDILARIADACNVEYEARWHGWKDVFSVIVRSRGSKHF